MTDRERLLRELNEGRTLLLVAMADLEEESGEARRAAGWRWLAAKGRWPLHVVRHEIGIVTSVGEGGVYEDPPPTSGWEWWREKEGACFGCSLPPVLIEHVRKLSETPKGQTCRFESPSQALGCAATCAGVLLDAGLLD